tara:strand:- start:1647 stop:2357 length:711 start_codon:yes stop_codon:yes gene_type:complete
MAKQIKWMKVDADTQVSIAIASPAAGPANPNLAGLDQQFDWNLWNYGTCDDSVTINSASNDNFIFEISDADYIADIKGKIEEYVAEWKESAYTAEKNLRVVEFSNYDSTAYAAGVGHKYDAAVAFLNNGTANAGLTTEAAARGITVTALANKIKTNHESFITKDAQISGIRGMLYDRIASIGVNTTSVSTALASYAGIHTNEIVGSATTAEVPYYKPEGLDTRFQIENGTYFRGIS